MVEFSVVVVLGLVSIGCGLCWFDYLCLGLACLYGPWYMADCCCLLLFGFGVLIGVQLLVFSG